MASTKLMETKAGKKFYQISVSRGYGKAPYKTRWYIPDGWSKRTIERELKKVSAEFERACAAGEVMNREQVKQKAAEEAAEAAKIKTVKQYGDGVFMPTKEATISENTRVSYRNFLNKHIYPAIGDVLLPDVSTVMCRKLLTDYQKAGYSHAAAVKLYVVMSLLFDMAFQDDAIPISPMLKVKRPVPRDNEAPQEESEKAFTVSELSYILSCVEQESLKWKTYIHVMADTGLRRGECCGLQWADIDFHSGEITVRHNLQYTAAAGVYDKRPKNKKVRVVDVGPDALALLRRLREDQASTCISKWVFTQDGSAEPMFPQSPNHYFQKFAKKFHVDGFHPHKLRHTSASVALTHGADVVSVSERLGHSDTAVTLRMYAHANQESIRRAGQVARDALKRAQNE